MSTGFAAILKKVSVVVTLAALCCTLAFLCGCTDENGDIPDKAEVEQKVHKECPTERITLVSVDHEDSTPKKDTYHYASKERDLTFNAISTLQQVTIDATQTGWYSKSVYCSYNDAVRNYYLPQVNAIEEQTGLVRPEHYGLHVSRFDDLAIAAKAIQDIKQVYAQESAYNTQEWIESHLKCSTTVWTYNDAEKPVNIASISVLESDYESALHTLQMQYARLVSEGKIPDDPTIPSSIANQVHRQTIDAIYVNATHLTDSMANANGTEYNQGEDVFTAQYDYDLTEYKVKLDVAITDEKCGPHPLIAYVEAAGGFIDVDWSKGKATWTIGGDKYVMTASKDSDGHVGSFNVKRNNKNLSLRWKQSGHETYMVYIPVTDLGYMLGLDPQIDESASTITFR